MKKDVFYMKINILKCHGTGNDFILIDEYNNDYNFSEEGRKELAILACNREKSIGGDGILFVQKSSICDAKMRIFNSDGSEAEMCGNGLRCVGRYVMEILKKDEIQIETMKAKYFVQKQEEVYKGIKTVKIFIDSISLDPKSLPMNSKKDSVLFENVPELSDQLKFAAISITNPHLISIVNEIDTNELVEVGVKGNSTKSVLPKGVNVSFVKVFDEKDIYVKTYERGVGLTKSCGTAMTASSVAACLSGKVDFDRKISIFNDGGMINSIVHKKENGNYLVEFIGNATFVFEGTMEFSNNEVNNVIVDNTPYEEETKDYAEFFKYTRKCIQ
ncbi:MULTISPECIES: diaminopimelate epimerase [Clostridium]|uniref:diaminopimelate epimerase n=1 Tax=Clostridium TaxID=1485 RepID=UPI001E5E8702|nr:MULTISPECIES: diaminopimelate epimerase [Clostridium]MCD2347359.1 diaminopimelate epimerase [Clostridium guangxiense]